MGGGEVNSIMDKTCIFSSMSLNIFIYKQQTSYVKYVIFSMFYVTLEGGEGGGGNRVFKGNLILTDNLFMFSLEFWLHNGTKLEEK